MTFVAAAAAADVVAADVVALDSIATTCWEVVKG